MRTELMVMTMLVVAAFASHAQAVEQMKQGSTYPLVFFMADANDHITGLAGLSPTVTLRKSNTSAAGSFGTPRGTVRGIANGWYQVDGNAGNTDTLGPLILHATATGADPSDKSFEVVAYDPSDPQRMGLTVLPPADAGASEGLPTGDSSGRVDVSKFAGSTTPVTNLGTIYNTDFASLYDSTNHVWKADAARVYGAAWVTHASGMVAADMRDISGTAVNASSAQLGVNVVNFGGSAGTFSGGRPEVNLTRIAGQSLAPHFPGVLPVQPPNLVLAATLDSGAITGTTTLHIGIADFVNAYKDDTVLILYQGNLTDISVRKCTSYDESTQELVLDSAPAHPLSVGDVVYVLAPPPQAVTTDARVTMALPNVTPAANGGLATVDSNNRIAGVQGTVNNLNNLDAAVSSRLAPSTTGRTLDVNTSHQASTDVAATRAEIDANSTQLAAIKSDLDGAPTFADAMNAQHYTVARADKLDNLDMAVSGVRNSAPSLLLNTTISGAPTSQTTFALSAGPPDNGALNGALVVVTSSTNAARKAVGLVKSYVASTKTVTLIADPGIYTMASGDSVDVIAAGAAVPLWLAH